jgi:catechol 2,3-dioxygenase-like lactoylglutathione lyase family enzyme
MTEARVDIGLTHIAFAVRDVEASIDFYDRYVGMQVVHERPAENGLGRIVWLSDLTRPFVLVLAPSATPDPPLGPFGHLGIGLPTRDDVDRLAALAKDEGRLRMGPTDSGPPVGYWVFIDDPDGHTIELTFGQEVGLAVFNAAPQPAP